MAKTGADARHAAAEYLQGLVDAKMAIAEIEGERRCGRAEDVFGAVRVRLNEMISSVTAQKN